jgi:hypothetical protein
VTEAELKRELARQAAVDTTYVPGGQDDWSKAFASVRGAGLLDELQSGHRVQGAMETAYRIGFLSGYRLRLREAPPNIAGVLVQHLLTGDPGRAA